MPHGSDTYCPKEKAVVIHHECFARLTNEGANVVLFTFSDTSFNIAVDATQEQLAQVIRIITREQPQLASEAFYKAIAEVQEKEE